MSDKSNHQSNSKIYPDTKDSRFQKKIAVKKEFHYNYDSSEKSCNEKSSIVSLHPHQQFVKRFISNNTHYNGLLMFHGLGSGKTCSAIGICEETRKYIKYNKNFKKILIIASPNVQENFQLQLFDEHKLKKKNNMWTIEGCVGSYLLDEIGIHNGNNMKKEEIIKKIKKLIRKYYSFMGYIEFSNKIENIIDDDIDKNRNNLIQEYKDRLIVIDEIHNIRTKEESYNDKSEIQKVAKYLQKLVNHVKHMKLIFLTGTPIFNQPEEIVYILNLLNSNDRKKKENVNHIFNKDGSLKKDGEKKILHLANGYISYVRGDNPYIFPHLVTPIQFDTKYSSLNDSFHYPKLQFNNKKIKPIQHLDLYINNLDDTHQKHFYIEQINKMKQTIRTFESIDKINYHEILEPLQCLNIIYPYKDKYLLGSKGIEYIMSYKKSGTPIVKHSFSYNHEDSIFNRDNIGFYSIKIKNILEEIIKSEGIILIYSQWIDSGILPMALALEELGYSRYGSKTKNLINNKKISFDKGCGSYSIICGDKLLTPNYKDEVYGLTNNNSNGEKVKIVLITQSGTEGIDLKNIRQVHIMEPWYNMNRIEQIIGRARRNCSHKELDKEKRNVQVYLHGTVIYDTNIETLDMYMYRQAEIKAISIGKITRLLKQNAIDCLLNENQKDFSKLDKTEYLTLSNQNKIEINLRDKPFTNICDYQNNCDYLCTFSKKYPNEEFNYDSDKYTYKYEHLFNHFIIEHLRKLFHEKYVYTENEIYKSLEINKNIKKEEIQYAIEHLMKEHIMDQYGEKGKIIKIGNLLLFQPLSNDYLYTSFEKRIIKSKRPYSFEMKEVEPEIYKYTIKDFITMCKEKYNTYKNKNEDLFKLFKFDKIKESDMLKIIYSMEIEYLDLHNVIDMLNEMVLTNNIEVENIFKPYFNGDTNILLVDSKNKESKEGKIKLYSLEENIWKPNYVLSNTMLKPFIRKINSKIRTGYIGQLSQGIHIKKNKFKIINHDEKIIETLEHINTNEKIIDNIDEAYAYFKKNKELFDTFMELFMRTLTYFDKGLYFLTKLEYLCSIKNN